MSHLLDHAKALRALGQAYYRQANIAGPGPVAEMLLAQHTVHMMAAGDLEQQHAASFIPFVIQSVGETD